MELISTGLKRYDGKDLKPGDRFECNDEAHERTLTTSRLAKRADAEESAGYQTRAMTARARNSKKAEQQ